MTLTMAQEQALTEVIDLLYTFLPASGAPITFGTVASEVGVGDLWPGVRPGLSKRPAITELLRATLTRRPNRFSDLIEHVVRRSLGYRSRKQNPLTRGEVRKLNAALLRVGFKIPELCAQKFLESLTDGAAAQRPQEPPQPPPEPPRPREPDIRPQLNELTTRFLRLAEMTDRQKAGCLLESLLNELFALFDLEPSEPFRVIGEQIDGCFDLDRQIYLIEAKWTSHRVDQAALLVLRGKIEGKSQFTRGLFLSINGFTEEATAAITRGKSPNFVMMDGAHLFRVLEGNERLDVLLRRLVRHLATTGEPYLPASRF